MNWQKQSEELWGRNWKLSLSRCAGVAKRTVQRWATGELKIRPDVVDKIEQTYRIWRG